MKEKRLRVGLLFASILLLLGAALAAWPYLSWNPAPDQILPSDQSIPSITILSPADRTAYPADASIPILVSTFSPDPLTALELWVDGRLLETHQPPAGAGQVHTHQFFWSPASLGTARVLVRGTTSGGQSAASNPIQIQINEAAGARLLAPDGVESPVREVSLPAPVEAAAPAPEAGQPQEPLQQLTPGKTLEGDFSLWLDSQLQINPTRPEAPQLSYSWEDCQVTLVIEDRSENELGFFLYRSGPGSTSFQRIAELEQAAGTGAFSFSDPDASLGAIYYAAAFNSAGESPGPPIQISAPDPACSGLGESGEPDLPEPDELEILDLAYVYYSFDGSGYRRFPSQPEDFLTPSEYPTSLRSVVEGLAAKSSTPVRQADVVLWGWSGGALVNLGAYHLEIDDSRLQVCNLGTGCTGDAASGLLSTYGELANDAEDQRREFTWFSTAPGTTAVLWQIATTPFSDDFSPQPYGLAAAGCSEGGTGGTFLVDFQTLDDYRPAPTACGGLSQTGFEFSRFSREAVFFPALETHYYIRFIPFRAGQPAGKPSNVVEILARPGESIIEPVIVDHLPEIYQVEVVDFTPIKKMDPRYWGCVFITGLDYDAIWDHYRSTYPAGVLDQNITQMADQLYNDLNYAVQNNLIVCPAPYESSGSGSVLSEWGSMLMDSLQELWDGVVSAFNALKAEVVDQVASAINKLGIPCDTECRAGLQTGLEIGITYFTGIPPNLPSFEQLKNQGLEYAIEMAAAEAGIPCPEACQQVLREGLEEVVDAAGENNTQPGCVGENWANALGKHSLCLPPGVDTDAVPEGVSEPARATIQVTRTGQETPGPYQYHDQPAYVVQVRFLVENSALSGTEIPYTYRYWEKGHQNRQESFTISAPVYTLMSDVFDSQSVPIPPLAPGESITIPLSLVPHTYYIPEHLHSLMIELNNRDLEIEDVGGVGGSRGTNFDWRCLHDGGKFTIEASVACLSMEQGLIGSTMPGEDAEHVSCGSEAQPYIYQETSDACYP